MTTVTFYIQKDGIIYKLNGGKGAEQGKIQNADAESFLSQKKPGRLNVILPKPELIFRKIQFPFSGRRKINLVLPSELENMLPEDPLSYRYSFEFFYAGKNRTDVNVYAIQEITCSYWKNLAKKHGAKLSFFSDALLFNGLLNQYTAEKNHIAVYGIEDYLLVNITENGIPSGFYSYDFKPSGNAEVRELIKDIISRKDLPVFVYAEDRIKQEFLPAGTKINTMEILPGIEKQFLFHSLASVKAFKKLQPAKLSHVKKLPVYGMALAGILLIASILSFSTYLRASGKQRQIDKLNADMNGMFAAAFPEAAKIVDPLAQAKEKVLNGQGSAAPGFPSVLKNMAEITSLFPEGMNAQVDQFTVSGNNITVSGSVDTLRSLETVKTNIENSKNFTITNMGTISFDSKNRVNFNITIGII
ncbi:MAG: hypothetical protein JW957_07790 [Candidatus Omnitrophica bacterium]|nr:hypothetical protein [Candidatus Omnitrophota bacterium]